MTIAAIDCQTSPVLAIKVFDCVRAPCDNYPCADAFMTDVDTSIVSVHLLQLAERTAHIEREQINSRYRIVTHWM